MNIINSNEIILQPLPPHYPLTPPPPLQHLLNTAAEFPYKLSLITPLSLELCDLLHYHVYLVMPVFKSFFNFSE